MTALGTLNPRLVLLDSKPGVPGAECQRIAASLPGSLPAEYWDLCQEGTELEFELDQDWYVRVWTPGDVWAETEASGIRKYLSDALAIGDDGGGSFLVHMNGREGPGLYLVSGGDPDIDTAKFIAPSVKELLTAGVGLDVIASDD